VRGNNLRGASEKPARAFLRTHLTNIGQYRYRYTDENDWMRARMHAWPTQITLPTTLEERNVEVRQKRNREAWLRSTPIQTPVMLQREQAALGWIDTVEQRLHKRDWILLNERTRIGFQLTAVNWNYSRHPYEDRTISIPSHHPIIPSCTTRSHPINEEAAADRKTTRTDDTTDTDITTGIVDAAATVVVPLILIRIFLFSICLCMNPTATVVVLLSVLNFGSSSSCFRVLTTNSQVPVVSQTTMQSNLFHSLEVIT